jgi:PTH1 family peptidyl-tRNA hydrolase
MKVVVGLGNPGKEYADTRHNVGFMVVDVLAQGGRFQSRFQGQLAELIEDSEKLLLVKPETFMNLSGRCVRQVIDFYKVPLTDLLIVCDDMSLPLGKLRFRAKGTHGGHNGLRNIQELLGTTEYARLRIGVDAPREDNAVGHVLGKFKPGERGVVTDAIALAVQGVLVWARQGIDVSMNQFNG